MCFCARGEEIALGEDPMLDLLDLPLVVEMGDEPLIVGNWNGSVGATRTAWEGVRTKSAGDWHQHRQRRGRSATCLLV